MRFSRIRASGVRAVVGFGLSMAVLAAVSLLLIPAIIRTGGQEAWGTVALGQSVGMVAAVVIYFGWGISGPMTVARASKAQRWREFSDSVTARLAVASVALPVTAAVAAVIRSGEPVLAALAACTSGVVGLTSAWYFIGTRAPFTMFFAETVPRAVGSVAGIILMERGAGVVTGLSGQLVGMVVGMAIPIAVIRRQNTTSSPAVPKRPLRVVLASQGHGVSSSAVGALYSALPVVIVSFVAPSSLVIFAILDKIQKQLYTALQPVVSVLQGWVAVERGDALRRRITTANLSMASFAGAVGLTVTLAGAWLVEWLGAGMISVGTLALLLTGLWLALNLEESVASKVSLVPLGKTGQMARITAAGSLLGLILVGVLAAAFGTLGALVGVCLGLTLRIAWCLAKVRTYSMADRPDVDRNNE